MCPDDTYPEYRKKLYFYRETYRQRRAEWNGRVTVWFQRGAWRQELIRLKPDWLLTQFLKTFAYLLPSTLKLLKNIISLQSWRNFGERVPSNILTKIMAAIFDFNDSERLGRERNLYQGGGWRSKIRREVGVGKWRVLLSPAPYPHRPLWLQIKHGRSEKWSRAYNVSCTAGFCIINW